MKMKVSLIDLLAYFFVFGFSLAGTLVSLHRFWQYEVFYYDFGIFDRAIWQVSRFQAPIIDHLVVGGKWIFADHFSPSIFLLSPLYWLTSRSEVLLIAQAVVVGLSGLVLYRLGRAVLKEKLASLAVVVCYLLFVGLQNAIITDFHEVTVMTLPLMLTFWAMFKKRPKLYFFFLLVTLGFKESTFLLGLGLGLFILLTRKDWRRIGGATMAIALVWGLVSIKVVIPFFADRYYQYSPVLPEGLVGKAMTLFNHPLKRRTLFLSFLSFGLLPVLHWPSWPLMGQNFLARFLPESSFTRWDLGLHYSADLAPLLAIAAVMALKKLKEKPAFSRFLLGLSWLLMINAFWLHQFLLHGPLGMAYNLDFYHHTRDFSFLNQLIARVPPEVSVMTQNNLVVRFTHQPVWILRLNYADFQPDYVVIDAREGQNPNDFFGTEVEHIPKIIENIQRDTNYETEYQTEEQYIFRKVK